MNARSAANGRNWSGEDSRGLAVAAAILTAWTGHLVAWFTVDLATVHPLLVAAGVLVQTFLFTGLFITAHEAMHGLVTPSRRKLNDAVGQLATTLYALFSYRRLRHYHWEHHRHPGVPGKDPDYHDGRRSSLPAWYFRFFSHYVTIWQLVGMAALFNVLLHLAGVPLANLLLLWVLPALASTLQLFYFGTFLPHRPPQGHDNEHNSSSNEFPLLLSFFTCYHFGYHLEHHLRPDLPWWRLPAYYRERREEG